MKTHMKTHNILAELSVIVFKEGEKYVAYTPALDLSSSGSTCEQAQKRLVEAINIFIEETLKMGTLDNVLIDCGWQKVSKPQKHWIPPHIIAHVEQQVKIPVAI